MEEDKSGEFLKAKKIQFDLFFSKEKLNQKKVA